MIPDTSRDDAERADIIDESQHENRELKRKNRELEETIEILKGGDKFLRAGEPPATPGYQGARRRGPRGI